MALSALDWCSVDRLKEHLSFFKDANGNFTNSEQDTKLTDCIQGAVSWCSVYTGLPLVRRLRRFTIPAPQRPDSTTGPILLRDIVGFNGVESAWLVPDNDFEQPFEWFNGTDNYQTPGRWLPNSPQTFQRQQWLIYPAFNWLTDSNEWPELRHGLVLDVIEDTPATRNASPDPRTVDPSITPPVPFYRDYTAVTSAIVLVARDLYDGGGIKERKSTAEHLLDPFKVPTIT